MRFIVTLFLLILYAVPAFAATEIQLRGGSAGTWSATTGPAATLAQYEIGVEGTSAPFKLKIGDGATAWSSLPYWGLYTYSDIVGLWTSCGSGYLKGDGTCGSSGNVSNNGTPALHQIGVWYDSTHVKGVAVAGSKVMCSDANGEPVACGNLTDTAFSTAVPSATTSQIYVGSGSPGVAVASSAIPNGVTATTQTAYSGDTKLATDAYVDAEVTAIAQNSQSAAYTLVLADAGKQIYHPSADTTARTWTIPANASVAYPIGTALTFINDTSGGTITIAVTSDTMILAGAGTTGSRTLAANGVATAIKITATRWIISGGGLT